MKSIAYPWHLVLQKYLAWFVIDHVNVAFSFDGSQIDLLGRTIPALCNRNVQNLLRREDVSTVAPCSGKITSKPSSSLVKTLCLSI